MLFLALVLARALTGPKPDERTGHPDGPIKQPGPLTVGRLAASAASQAALARPFGPLCFANNTLSVAAVLLKVAAMLLPYVT